MSDAPAKLLHSVAAVAAMFSLSEGTVRRLIQEKQLAGVFVGNALRVTDESVQRVAAAGAPLTPLRNHGRNRIPKP